MIFNFLKINLFLIFISFTVLNANEIEDISVTGNQRISKETIQVLGNIDLSKNFDSIEKNSMDLYSSMKSIFLQDREKKIKNSSDSGDDDWGNLDK